MAAAIRGALALGLGLAAAALGAMRGRQEEPRGVELSAPRLDGEVSLERALRERRSLREFARAPLSRADVAQLCWAAQGITAEDGGRTAPSAGGLYPLELHLVVGRVEGLDAGVYRYAPGPHRLVLQREGDQRVALCDAALGQDMLRSAPAVLVIAAVYARTTGKYGERGRRYVHMEAGHAAQNACLQASASGLGTVVVGAFEDERVQRVLGLPRDQRPLYLMPVGRPR